MIKRLAAGVFILIVAVLQPIPTLAHQPLTSSRSHPLSVRQVKSLCSRSGSAHPNTWVTGYFQRGPISDGPFFFQGFLYDSAAAKLPAGTVPSTPAQRKGLPIFMVDTLRLSRTQKAAIQRIRPGRRVLAHGTVVCSRGRPGLKADEARAVGRS